MKNRYDCHSIDKDQYKLIDIIRNRVKALDEVIETYCPKGREKSLALTKLEECLMWANKAISMEEETDAEN